MLNESQTRAFTDGREGGREGGRERERESEREIEIEREMPPQGRSKRGLISQ